SPCWVITKSSEAILAFGVSASPHAIAAHRVCANLSGTSSVSVSNLSTSAPPIRGYASMAGLKYRWKISPKKSYSCSLIAPPQVSDGHLNCAPVPSAEHEFGQDGGVAAVDAVRLFCLSTDVALAGSASVSFVEADNPKRQDRVQHIGPWFDRVAMMGRCSRQQRSRRGYWGRGRCCCPHCTATDRHG